MIEQASNHRDAKYAEQSLRNAPANIVAAVNRARKLAGLPAIGMPEARIDDAAPAIGVYWDPASPHRPRSPAAARLPAPPVRASRGALVTRVLMMPAYMDAAALDVGRSLPESISAGAFGPAADLNRGAWSLRDDHGGPAFDYAGPRLRAIDTPHGLVIEWQPNMRMVWAADAVRAIEEGRNAVSAGMWILERRISHLPHPVEMITRARLDHVALLIGGERGCYPGSRARVFRSAWSDDRAELEKHIEELIATCRWYARDGRGR